MRYTTMLKTSIPGTKGQWPPTRHHQVKAPHCIIAICVQGWGLGRKNRRKAREGAFRPGCRRPRRRFCSSCHATRRSPSARPLASTDTDIVTWLQGPSAKSSGGCSARAMRPAPPSRAAQTPPLCTCPRGSTRLDASCSWNRRNLEIALYLLELQLLL